MINFVFDKSNHYQTNFKPLLCSQLEEIED